MKINLTVTDRLNMQGLCPQKGNLINLTISRAILDKIKFSTKEIDEFELKQEVDQKGVLSFQWNKEKAKEIKIDLEDCELKLLKEQIEKTDKDENLTMAIVITVNKIKELE